MHTTQVAGPQGLAELLPGLVLLPGQDGFDEARSAFNLHVDQRPAAIVSPETAEQVAQVVSFAARHGYLVAPQSTGHNAAPIDWSRPAILLKTSAMRRVEIDPVAQLARAEAGVRWQDVIGPAAAYGLSVLHGSTPHAGVVGYSLGGGMGWQVRKHGLAANSVTAVELVDAQGDLRRVDAAADSELFWALRGGGGANFGVVTAIEFRLYPVAALSAGWLMWPWEESGPVLQAWASWKDTLPDEVTTVGRILQFPPIEEIPAEFRGAKLVVVEVIALAEPEQAGALLAPMRALSPQQDTFGPASIESLAMLHMDPEEPGYAVTDHTLLSELGPDGIEAFVAATGPGSGSDILSVELRQLGGAAARRAPGNGALAAIDAAYAMFAVTVAQEPQDVAAATATLARIRAALEPYEAGDYLNFVEEPAAPSRFFDEVTLARLRAVRDRMDPGGVFLANHRV